MVGPEADVTTGNGHRGPAVKLTGHLADVNTSNGETQLIMDGPGHKRIRSEMPRPDRLDVRQPGYNSHCR
ncbi:hypothetical protein RRG08_016092 [Elysia crispata]|uniref:Uncharacterized protein n=1 Tax=Elysia crispata TaxID=231223 RepID=A0AAE1DJ94_9GAST|nr:hypothetical protein RRG08_016092 [Elysia crispata]